jgi:hypothetical protein
MVHFRNIRTETYRRRCRPSHDVNRCHVPQEKVSMKNTSSLKGVVIGLVSAAILAASTPHCAAQPYNGGAVAVDVLLVRPFCLLGTICGSAIFVISLPVAIPSKSVHSAAHALVVKPAQATFTRPLGDLDDLSEYEY